MYKPTPFNANLNINKSTQIVSDQGVNTRDLETILDPKNALKIDNYDIKGIAILATIKGYIEKVAVVGGGKLTMLEEFKDDIWIFAYDNILAKIIPSTDVISTINTFTTSNKFSGVVAGDFFFTCNGDTRIGRVNATATTFTENTDVNTPKADLLFSYGGRLYSNDLDVEGRVVWSNVDDGVTTPFQDYTPATSLPNLDESFFSIKHGVGFPVGFGALDQDVILVTFQKGRVKFFIDSEESGGVFKQKVVTIYQSKTAAGNSKVLSTQKGAFYCNDEGVFFAPFGELRRKEDVNILLPFGQDIIADLNFEDSDLILFNDILWITVRRKSTDNNLILKYNFLRKGWSTRSGISVNVFMSVGKKLYAGSSKLSSILQLESGFSDKGNDIRSEYLQTIPADWSLVQTLVGFFVQGRLSASSSIEISFDGIMENGTIKEKIYKKTWTRQGLSSSSSGIGTGGIGVAGLGGTKTLGGMALSKADVQPYLKGLTGLRVRFVSIGRVPSEVHILSTKLEPAREIRNSNLT